MRGSFKERSARIGSIGTRLGGPIKKIGLPVMARAAQVNKAPPAFIKPIKSREAKPILDRDPAADLWRKVGIPRSRDIRHLLPPSMPRSKRFETPSDVKVRKKKLILILEDLEPAIADGYDNAAVTLRARSLVVLVVHVGIEDICTARRRASTDSPLPVRASS